MGLRDNWLMRWCRRRVVDPLILFMRKGTEPKQLAFSAALGITVGVFPVYGATALLCGIVGLILRSKCHAPTLMIANLVATPIELSLIVPFLRFGELLTGADHIVFSASTFTEFLSGHIPHQVLRGLLYAILGWVVASPGICFGLYYSFLPLFQKLSRKIKTDAPLRQYPNRTKAAVV